MSTDELFDLVERRARVQSDGHFTLLRFTTHWKAFFGTCDLDGVQSERDWVHELPAFRTLKETLEDLLVMHREYPKDV